jgi:hypothetical protein
MPQEPQTPVAAPVQDEPAAKATEERQADHDHGSATDRLQPSSGLSKAERELVEKMQSIQAQNHRKLEAVA